VQQFCALAPNVTTAARRRAPHSIHRILQQVEWRRYKPGNQDSGQDSGVQSFALLTDGILIRFRGDDVYLYDHDRPGATHVKAMRILALQGSGLSTYISRHVRERYAARLSSTEAQPFLKGS